MRLILAALLLTFAALAQSVPTRISPDEAEKHLIKKYPAMYPQPAHAGHIQGNVIIEIGIDESGVVVSRRLVSGHPLLGPAAMDAVTQWKYQPFVVAGKASRVITLTMVSFGDTSSHQTDDRAEILFQHNFWFAEESASAALAMRDYAGAEQYLNGATSLLVQQSDRLPYTHTEEHWQLMVTMGRVRMGQQKYDDAEQCFKKALNLREAGDKDTPGMAETLRSLGGLYFEEKQYELAREYSNRSMAIYRKNFRRVGSKNPAAQRAYGLAIASQAWMLAKVALEEKDQAEAGTQCQAVMEFRDFLVETDRQSVVSACQDTISRADLKN